MNFSNINSDQLMGNLPGAILLTDIEGKVLDANDNAYKLLGYEKEKLVGLDVEEFAPEDSLTFSFDQIFEREKSEEFSRTISIDKKGSKIPLELKGSKLVIEGEERVLVTVRDISDKENTVEGAKESEKEFRKYLGGAPVGVFLVDADGNFLEVNEAIIELIGYPREELLEMSFKDILSSETVDSTMETFEGLLESGEMREETTYRRKNGSETQVIVNAVEVERDRYIVFTLDVTKSQETERKLKQNKERLETAMVSGNLAWWRMELPSGKVSFSDLKATMLGYSPDRFEHYEDFTELIHPEDHDKAMNAMRAHLNGEEERYEVEYRIRKKDGDYKWYRDIGSLNTVEGEYKVLTGIVIDVDERKEAELALEDQRSKLKELHDAVDKLQQCETEEELFSVAVQTTKNILEFDSCIFYRAKNDELVPTAVTEDINLEDTLSLNQDEALAGKTFQKSSSILGDDLQKEDRAFSNRTDLKGYLSVPIGDLGVFQAGTTEAGAFDEGDLDLAEILAGHLYEELKRISLEEELKQQAIRDPLTGLYNRRYFNETLKKEAERSKRYNEPLAFLMIDVNKFKKINDNYSHQTGDKILEKVARLLEENFRDADTVVRYGGDEFLVMMPETEVEVTKAVNRLNQELEQWNEQSDLLDSTLALAVGVSHWTPDQDRSVEEALKEADKKMYEDKNSEN